MKRIILALLLSIAFTPSLYAQDAIYTANGNRLPDAHITDLTDDRVAFTVQKEGKTNTYNFQRDNVLAAFRNGNFLIIKSLSSDLAQAKKELQVFLTTTAWAGKDYLLRAVPFRVIPAKIKYDRNDIINYLTDAGQAASIAKADLVAIFYSDGRYSLIKEPASEAISILADLKKPLGENTLPVTAQSKPAPKQPEPSVKTTDDSTTQRVETKVDQIQSPKIESNVAPQTNKMVLSGVDYQYYRKKAIGKVEEFSSYLNVITNKSLSTSDRNQAIDQAASLFMPAATIEVTSSKRPGARRYPIRTYLNNLKLLPYSATKIEWTDINYVKEFSQAADGNYYGLLTGQQTFFGYGNGVSYTDITQKNVRVKIDRIYVTRNGQDEVKWNLLLGSIGVSN